MASLRVVVVVFILRPIRVFFFNNNFKKHNFLSFHLGSEPRLEPTPSGAAPAQHPLLWLPSTPQGGPAPLKVLSGNMDNRWMKEDPGTGSGEGKTKKMGRDEDALSEEDRQSGDRRKEEHVHYGRHSFLNCVS